MPPPEVSLPRACWALPLGLVALALLAGPTAGEAVAACAVAKSTAYDDPAQFTGYEHVYATQSAAQSFTVPAAVTLNRVSLRIANYNTPENLTVAIHSDAGGAPGALLASRGRVPPNTTDMFVDFDFSADNIALAPGATYYVVATTTATPYGYYWSADNSSPAYPGGSAFIKTGGGPWVASAEDLLFQVWGQTCVADSQPSLPDTTPPGVSRFGLANTTFRGAGKGGSIARKKPPVGTRVRYRLSEAATARFTIERVAKGRKKGRRCAAPTNKNRKAKSCTRYVLLKGSFSRPSKAGLNSFRFTGRLRGKKLRPGRHRLVMVASDAAKNKSKPKRASFRIVLR